jgi:hypothetical protein
LSDAGDWAIEAAICFAQAFFPFAVSRSSFQIMRRAWLARAPLATDDALHPTASLAKADVLPIDPQRSAEAQQESKASAALGTSGNDGNMEALAAARAPDGGPTSHLPPCFVAHVLACLDADMPKFVGLSIEMGVVIVGLILLTGAFGGWRALLARVAG